MTTADRIRNLRLAKQITQQEFGDSIKMNQSVVNRIERGTRPVRDDELKTIAQYFGVSTDYLLDNEVPRDEPSANETLLIKKYRRLSDIDQQTINHMVDRFLQLPINQTTVKGEINGGNLTGGVINVGVVQR